MRALRWIVALAVVLCAIVAATGFVLLQVVRHRVESHAPRLVAESTPETDFTFHTLDGQAKKLSDFKGKVVFLDLWGTWCIQCVAEMPTVQKLYEHYSNDPEVQFLIVSRMDSAQTVQRFARRGEYTLPFYVMRDQDVPPSMYLRQYPATFLYSPDGMLRAHHAGGADWDDPSALRFIESLKRQ